ncbi:hypothetical protein E3V08_05145 [Candidatus Atribacteria bacterium MT.SAG.1]|nr:hypothetical protein E3V08_05145 [Candidatus Atribacteria bacterium MT.SAG.1]
MMKETKKSLKAYFLLIGILGILVSIGEVFLYFHILTIIFGFVRITISGLFIYYGIKMYDYLQKSPKTLINFVIITISINAVLYLIGRQLIYVAVLALLGWYLVHNIKKLSIQQPGQEIAKTNF